MKGPSFSKKNRALACALKTALKRPFQTRYGIELKSAKSSQTRTNEQEDIVTARFCSLVSNSLLSTCVKKRWGIFVCKVNRVYESFRTRLLLRGVGVFSTSSSTSSSSTTTTSMSALRISAPALFFRPLVTGAPPSCTFFACIFHLSSNFCSTKPQKLQMWPTTYHQI